MDFTKLISKFSAKEDDTILHLCIFGCQAKRMCIQRSIEFQAYYHYYHPTSSKFLYLSMQKTSRIMIISRIFYLKYFKCRKISQAVHGTSAGSRKYGFFTEWIDGLKIQHCNSPKEIVTDQLKRTVPYEILIILWMGSTILSSTELVEKLERRCSRRVQVKTDKDRQVRGE